MMSAESPVTSITEALCSPSCGYRLGSGGSVTDYKTGKTRSWHTSGGVCAQHQGGAQRVLDRLAADGWLIIRDPGPKVQGPSGPDDYECCASGSCEVCRPDRLNAWTGDAS